MDSRIHLWSILPPKMPLSTQPTHISNLLNLESAINYIFKHPHLALTLTSQVCLTRAYKLSSLLQLPSPYLTDLGHSIGIEAAIIKSKRRENVTDEEVALTMEADFAAVVGDGGDLYAVYAVCEGNEEECGSEGDLLGVPEFKVERGVGGVWEGESLI